MKKEKNQNEAKPTKSFVLIVLHLVVLVGLSLLIGFILQKNKISMPFDRFFYELVQKVPHVPPLEIIMSIFDYSFLPNIGLHPQFMVLLVVIPVIYAAFKKPKEFWWIVLALAVGGIISRIMVFSDTALVFRERPYTLLPNQVSSTLKEALKGWTSFPSGHTRDTMMLGLIISYFLPKVKYFMIALALVVGFSRLYYGVHFPTDVLIGLLIGYMAYIIAIEFTNYIRNRLYPNQGSR